MVDVIINSFWIKSQCSQAKRIRAMKLCTFAEELWASCRSSLWVLITSCLHSFMPENVWSNFSEVAMVCPSWEHYPPRSESVMGMKRVCFFITSCIPDRLVLRVATLLQNKTLAQLNMGAWGAHQLYLYRLKRFLTVVVTMCRKIWACLSWNAS